MSEGQGDDEEEKRKSGVHEGRNEETAENERITRDVRCRGEKGKGTENGKWLVFYILAAIHFAQRRHIGPNPDIPFPFLTTVAT